MTAAHTAALAAVITLACQGSSGDRTPQTAANSDASEPAPPVRPLEVSDVYLDTARAPNNPKRPFIAGESIQVGMRIRGGTPPYKIRIRSERHDNSGVAVMDASTETKPSQTDARGVELAARTIIHARTPLGTYVAGVIVTDATGAETSDSVEIEILGDGVPVHTTPDPRFDEPPWAVVLDAGGRRRVSFLQGETVNVQALLGRGETRATVSITAQKATPLATLRQYALRGGKLEMSVDIPRLAYPGRYKITIAGKKSRTTTWLKVDGVLAKPVDHLIIDELRITGGYDGRAPRAGRFRAGEHIVIEARVGGGKKEITAVVRIRDGDLVHEHTFAVAPVTDPRRDARMYLRGSWKLPSDLSRPRQRIEIEVTEDDRVSTRYRDALIE